MHTDGLDRLKCRITDPLSPATPSRSARTTVDTCWLKWLAVDRELLLPNSLLQPTRRFADARLSSKSR